MGEEGKNKKKKIRTFKLFSLSRTKKEQCRATGITEEAFRRSLFPSGEKRRKRFFVVGSAAVHLLLCSCDSYFFIVGRERFFPFPFLFWILGLPFAQIFFFSLSLLPSLLPLPLR
jgi:hypothetical protein